MRRFLILLALPLVAACGDTIETSCESFCDMVVTCTASCDPEVTQCSAFSGLDVGECIATCTTSLQSFSKSCRDEAVVYNNCLAGLTCTEFKTNAGLEKCSAESIAAQDACRGE